MKAQDSNENELVLDLALRWAGNLDIVLGIKFLSLQVSVQVRISTFRSIGLQSHSFCFYQRTFIGIALHSLGITHKKKKLIMMEISIIGEKT